MPQKSAAAREDRPIFRRLIGKRIVSAQTFTLSCFFNGAWGTVTSNLSTALQDASSPQIALSSDGTKATATWRRYDGSNWVIQSASATITGNTADWNRVTNLSVIGLDAFSPQIALSSDGTRATAVWWRDSLFSDITNVQSASATITENIADWSSPVHLTDPRLVDAFNPQIALSSDGTSATSVWISNDGNSDFIQSRTATIDGKTTDWNSVADLSFDRFEARAPQIALSSDGAIATAVWGITGITSAIQTRSASINGNTVMWGDPVNFEVNGETVYAPQITLSLDGAKATSVWYGHDASRKFVKSASATVSGNVAAWGSISELSSHGLFIGPPQLSLSSDGTRAIAVWTQPASTDLLVQSTTATISGNTATWGSIIGLSPSGQDALNPRITLSSDGTASITLWNRGNGSNLIVQSRSAIIEDPSCYVINTNNGNAVVFYL